MVNIGNSAFTGCTSLTSASFLGNAPTMNSTVFATCAGGFTVYFLDGKTGFTTPTWNGYTAVNLGTTAAPAIWLLAHGQPYNADLRNDPNNDGVSLLVAYALNLDPNLNLSDRLPKPVLANNQLRLTYYAGMAGITYTVESSADMQTWSPGGVIVSDPDSNGFRAASVASGPARRFLRWSCAHPDARL